ncbi:hypothetical protein [Methylobacterium oxalidis]|uniref:Glycosyl transferase n=1 Tax=Methylobacterium oxalidis TaxID=944322 RepID=A0A512J457_9HYPH|nr:hypothetical protein [Methylobacterium oxalidis]GEP04722.1 hypothetical protein MOX02_27600 [Methylobacterium oxalidis]GJE32794.1 hypothetical protein LDDCCGHA_2983 [Methylobacterium oxalidis]GLS63223.1 hypothetical protein GCM10007888_16040 [Methylobacterium oxalidis]
MLSAASPDLEAARPARLSPNLLAWLLVAVSALTLNWLADIPATIAQVAVRDTDDAMRLVEVRDLVMGQGWFDNTQYRFVPPEGVPSHWSRLVDAPLAALLWLLTPLLGQHLALGVTAAFWPPSLFAVFACLLYRGVRAHFGTLTAILAIVAALQTLGLTLQFAPGRVDHHNVQLIAMLGLALCLAHGGGRAGAAAGAATALSLAVGLEALPFIAVAALFLMLDWVRLGRERLPAFVGFGAVLALCAPPLFALQTAPHLWSVAACDALSPPWLWLAVGGGLTALACAAADARLATPAARLGFAGILGGLVVAGFVALYPACLGGPFTGMPQLVKDKWLHTVNEMTPLATFLESGRWEIVAFFPALLLAALVAAWQARRGAPERRRYFLVAALFLWPGLVIGAFQFRGTYIPMGLLPLVAAPVFARAVALAGEAGVSVARRLGVAAMAVGLISSVWTLPFFAAALLHPLEAEERGETALRCLTPAAVAPLAQLPPGTMLALIRMGPAILLHTPHAIVAAPYHRALTGLTAGIESLGGSEADLRRHAGARGITYVVACPGQPAPDTGPETAFATRLAEGGASAGWLEPLDVPGTFLKVWRVR